ncbi:MAG TPA: MarR family winged helix-turn-helix transcriptional regulator [Thermomicrobiaceae bacterium]|nr:MarR family winged helix-turn-helix transcriptional regulator [Thermomicrobiaceae bacterium]
MSALPPSRIEWLSDLVHLEIALWNRVDARLRVEHGLSLAFFWPLYVVGRARDERLRVGELAAALGLTVGGTSKIVDRIAGAGLLRREPDAGDRRASRVALTDTGRSCLDAAGQTYEVEMATALDAALSADDQRYMHRLVRRLLDATGMEEPA